jgi:alkylation response protein AidB-like acyl-CoA dehydrogenase
MTIAGVSQPSIGEADLLRRAAGLVPVLRGRAAETEQLRQIPSATVQDIVDAGLLRIATPARYGGHGHEINLMFDVAMELGRGCGSTAWCYAVWSIHNWMLGHWPEEAQEEYFADGPNTLSSSAFAPTGRLEPVDGGFRLSGRWDFSSGCDAGAWAMLGAMSPTGPVFALVPRPYYAVIDTWFVAGLSGTGSKDIEVRDAFVPAHRVASMESLNTGRTPGWALHQRASYRLPMMSLLPFTLASPLVGMAQGAVEEFVERMKGKTGPGRTADSVALQIRLAESSAEVDAARLLVQERTSGLIARAGRDEAIDPAEQARYRRDHGYVARLCVHAVNRLFEASGGHALYQSQAMQRFFRDVHAGSHQVALSWDNVAEAYGRAAFGLPPAPNGRP